MIFTDEQKQLAYSSLMFYGNKLYEMAATIPNEQEIMQNLSSRAREAWQLAKDIISDDGTGIRKATAISSVGGIYLYYAELENGNWVMGNDGWLVIVNENPLKDSKTFDESCHYEWQNEHLVQDISDMEKKWWIESIIKAIEAGRTIKEYDNFLLEELKKRIKTED